MRDITPEIILTKIAIACPTSVVSSRGIEPIAAIPLTALNPAALYVSKLCVIVYALTEIIKHPHRQVKKSGSFLGFRLLSHHLQAVVVRYLL